MKLGWWLCAAVMCSYIAFGYYFGLNVSTWPQNVIIVWLLLTGLCWLNILIITYLGIKRTTETAP
jgi:hypothetical protein